MFLLKSFVVADAARSDDVCSSQRCAQHAAGHAAPRMQAVGLKFVVQQLHAKAAKHKNPKVLQEATAWTTRAATEFGPRALDTKAAVPMVKELLGHTNAGVRTAATEFAAVLHDVLGPPLLDALSAGVKPAMMSTVQASCAAAAALPEPVRQQRRAAPSRPATSSGVPLPPCLEPCGLPQSGPSGGDQGSQENARRTCVHLVTTASKRQATMT